MSTMTTLLRRETWEHRSIYIAPAIFAGLFVLLALLATAGAIQIQVSEPGVDVDLRSMIGSMDARQLGALIQTGLASMAVFFNVVIVLVTVFYLLDSLYAERKDRSILFWKSLPVSDLAVVTSKLLTAAVLIPLISAALFLATAVVIFLIAGTFALFSGSGIVFAVGPGAIADTMITLIYALLVQSLWYLPLYAWLLLVSAWSRRTVLLWAILPLWAVAVLEQMFLRTHMFAELLRERLVGVFPLAFNTKVDEVEWAYNGDNADLHLSLAESLRHLIDPGALLFSPGLWGGLVAAAVLTAAAIWIRRYRDET